MNTAPKSTYHQKNMHFNLNPDNLLTLTTFNSSLTEKQCLGESKWRDQIQFTSDENQSSTTYSLA